MFQDSTLTDHLQNSATIKNKSLITMEWNLNDATNISQIGNYRYDPTVTEPEGFKIYDSLDTANLYTGATDSSISIVETNDDLDHPIAFTVPKVKESLYYSLEDCFGRFRPRSGINKFRYFPNKKIPETSSYMSQRPRYYFAEKDDKFKYWTSYRTIAEVSAYTREKGISGTKIVDGGYNISDAAPFIIYKNQIPTNKIVIKMQTNVGTVSLSDNDPFYIDSSKTVPKKWKIQKLVPGTNEWKDIVSSEDSTITIGRDGYVEFSYGLSVDPAYADIFVYAGKVSSLHALPIQTYNGYAYFVESVNGFVIWLDEVQDYVALSTSYGWSQSSETLSNSTKFLTQFLKSDISDNAQYDIIKGLRIVVSQMQNPGTTFDLIELSPRLFADVSDRTLDYSITKQASDLSGSGLPVGQMLAATGSLSLFDYDQAFSENNQDSILYGLSKSNIQTKFYEAVFDVKDSENNINNYYIPIKTMYIEDFPQVSSADRKVTVNLRDLNIFFENTIAPQILLINKSLSYILVMLFDAIGFSNYQFLRATGERDDVIPYFFIGPDTSVSEVLSQLAISTQTAMFFDENNVFTMMSKNRIMPTETEKATDLTISADQNILAISSKQNSIYNSGKITYISRYIQKTYGSIEQATYALQDKSWIYKPVLLWEVAPSVEMRPTNEEQNNTSSYSLSAIPLNSDLSTTLPTVSAGKIINNIMDLGEGILWLSRYAGYFYANGEIIRYDAVEHIITGIENPVWISDPQEYANYFSKLTFNGKIYPTGRIRIYSEPNFNLDGTYKNGAVAKHGRGQFGTKVTTHSAGLASTWTDTTNLHGCKMDSSILFNSIIQEGKTGAAGVEDMTKSPTANTTVNGIIKDFLSISSPSESITNTLRTTSRGTIQSSALVMNGPSFETNQKPTDYLSYTVKDFSSAKYVHFGTRLRVIGTVGNSGNYIQQGAGSSPFYTDANGKTIGGAGGGLGILVNPKTNNGYYFEIAALTDNNVSNYSGTNPINNVFFYKITQDSSSASKPAVPTILWTGLAPILVDDGKFTGQSRMAGEQNPTVYDLAVEYEDNAGSRKFYLYINNKVIATVEDSKPLPHTNDNNMALFVRGSSRVMFENVYALSTNYAHNTSSMINAPISSAVFGVNELSIPDSFRKYAISGMVQATYLSGIGSGLTPNYNMYYDEFGTIMREVAYMNIRYDKAYPALIAKISPTFNNLKGYTISGFAGNPYGAEFLVFNNTDSVLTLDESSGNYLRIQGVTFTQQSQNELTVDDYFAKTSDASSYKFDASSISQANQAYNDIKASRMTYGKKEFVLDAPFIQSQDAANNLMSWIIKKVMRNRKSVGIEVFGLPIIQLGDIVKVDYTLNDVDEISSSRFVVYNMQYSKSENGPKTTMYLSEVL